MTSSVLLSQCIYFQFIYPVVYNQRYMIICIYNLSLRVTVFGVQMRRVNLAECNIVFYQSLQLTNFLGENSVVHGISVHAFSFIYRLIYQEMWLR